MSVVINGSAGVTTNSGAVYNGISAGTAVASTSGTSIDFTSIPSWVKRITVMFKGVSTSGTSVIQIQLGAGGVVETTGYNGNVSAGTSAGYYTQGQTTGFPLCGTTPATAANTIVGCVQICLLGSNSWSVLGSTNSSTYASSNVLNGSKDLAGALDRVRITTVNGTDAFDAGSINILYE